MLVYMVSIYSKFVFSHQITESQAFCFCKENYSVPHFKTLAQPTTGDIKTEKDSSTNGKQRVTENKIPICCMVGP